MPFALFIPIRNLAMNKQLNADSNTCFHGCKKQLKRVSYCLFTIMKGFNGTLLVAANLVSVFQLYLKLIYCHLVSSIHILYKKQKWNIKVHRWN